MSIETFPRKPRKVGLSLSILGAILNFGGMAFAFAPLGLAILTTPPGNNPYSEGGEGGGAVIWLMILTLPVGAIASLVGLVLMISGIVYTLKLKTPAASEDSALRSKLLKEKSVSVALLVPALMITQPVLSFVLGNMIIGGSTALVTIIASSVLIVVAIGISLSLAIRSGLRKVQTVIGILSVVFLGGIITEAYFLYTFFVAMNLGM